MNPVHLHGATARRRHGHALGAAALLALLIVAAAAAFTGCIEKEKVECSGGTVVDGECFPPCEADKCLEGNICVGLDCKLVCTSHRDCALPTQRCMPAGPDESVSGDPGLVQRAAIFGVCTDVGRFPIASTFGTPCPYGDECWATGCPNGMECDVNACDDGSGPHPELCAPDESACRGKEPCNIGTCSNTQQPCVVTTCELNECSPFVCLGEGVGDSEAYCTHHDCVEDTDCPGGWYCGVTRDPHGICGPTCDGGSCSDDGSQCFNDGECQKGNSNACGTTEEGCIPPEQFNADGKQLFEGSVCLLRRTCLKREPCVPCQNNLDCSLDPEAVCLDLAGQLNCARFCRLHGDCEGDELCTPSYPTCDYTSTLGCTVLGPDSQECPNLPCVQGQCATVDGQPGAPCASSAECPLQGCVERAICMPRTGSCRGTGGFCEHCIDDTDCGDASTSRACEEVTDGQFACFDMSFPDACPGGSDMECPEAPSGSRGKCLDEEFVNPGDSVYHRCYFPYSGSKGFTCWLWDV